MELQNIDSMKRIILLAVVLLIFSRSKAQRNDSIIYVLHFDSVETTIDKHLNTLEKKNQQTSSWSYLGRVDSLFTLTVCNSCLGDDSKAGFLSRLVKNTNRYLLIDKRTLPLILDYDTIFTTPKLTNIGSLGNRDGNVLRSRIILDCFTIVFDSNGKIIRIDN